MTDPCSLIPAHPQSPTPHPCRWYACVYRPPDSSASSDTSASSSLISLAADFSPRYECHGGDLVVIDVSGLDRMLGSPRAIGEELRRTAAARGLRIQVAVAATMTAARVLAHVRPGLTVVDRGGEASALAPIAISILEKRILEKLQTAEGRLQTPVAEGLSLARQEAQKHSALSAVSVLKRWGLRTLGDLAALPPDELAARLGRPGLVWQAIARGQDVRPLVPALPEERFEASMDLEWPIEGLEPLSFVLTRLLEPLSTRLERRDRGAAVLHLELGLVAHQDIQREAGKAGRAGGSGAYQPYPSDQTCCYTRSLQLPSPIRDVRTLRTLILLDLESHPPGGPIERVAILIDPTPGRVLQHTLFTRALPTPEQVSTLVARLNALMGEDRVGRPVGEDSYRPGAFGMMPFAVEHGAGRAGGSGKSGWENSTHLTDQTHPTRPVVSALRRCRQPVPARVAVTGGRPAFVTTDRRGFAGGHVLACAGPWRTSGSWWAGGAGGAGRSGEAWNRDEWDVSLSDGAVYRIFQDQETEGWFVDAIVD